MGAFDSKTLLGRAIRVPLGWIPESAVVRILSGPSAGAKWVVGAAPHGAWLGTLERSKLRHFVAHVHPGQTVWDIGANVGLYSLASSRAVGPSGSVVAFEPMVPNLEFLRRHVQLNSIDNLRIVAAAVFDREGTVRMAVGDSPSEFHIHAEGTIDVETIRLDAWSHEQAEQDQQFGLVPDVVKIDVEGAEDAVLLGGQDVLSQRRPLIYLALHGDEPRRRCAERLSTWGYELTPLDGAADASTSDEWFAEPR